MLSGLSAFFTSRFSLPSTVTLSRRNAACSRARAGFAAAKVGIMGGVGAVGVIGLLLAARGTAGTPQVVLPAPEQIVSPATSASTSNSPSATTLSTTTPIATPPADAAATEQVREELKTPSSENSENGNADAFTPKDLAPRPIVAIEVFATPSRGLGPPVPVEAAVEVSVEASDANASSSNPSSSNPSSTKPQEAPAEAKPQVSAPSTSQSQTPAKTPPATLAPTAQPKADAIDLNAATKAQLELLPGIGPALAQRIIDHRSKIGRFASVNGLEGVRGIGAKTLAKLQPYLMVSPAKELPATPAPRK